MKLNIVHNQEKGGIELHFDSVLPLALTNHLKEIGFTDYDNAPLKRFAKEHPAYDRYARDLQQSFENNTSWEDIIIYPSFKPSSSNITYGKFSKVTWIF